MVQRRTKSLHRFFHYVTQLLTPCYRMVALPVSSIGKLHFELASDTPAQSLKVVKTTSMNAAKFLSTSLVANRDVHFFEFPPARSFAWTNGGSFDIWMIEPQCCLVLFRCNVVLPPLLDCTSVAWMVPWWYTTWPASRQRKDETHGREFILRRLWCTVSGIVHAFLDITIIALDSLTRIRCWASA